MATLKQLYYRVLDNGEFKSSPGISNNFFKNNLLGQDKTNKISIQAPPGTEIQLDNKKIIVGRTGIYDFDNTDVPPITSLVFPQPVRYLQGATDPDYIAELEGFLDSIRGNIEELSEEVNYTTFCTEGQKIFAGEKSNDNSEYNFESREKNKILYGFQQVLQEYLKAIQGELYTTETDLMNVVINYITSD